MREFINRVRMNRGAVPALDGIIDADEGKKHERACPHVKIYGARDPGRIDFASFLKDLAGQANVPPELVKINFRDIYLSSDTAIYCGFILKELLANFHPGQKGRLVINLVRDGDRFRLVVSGQSHGFGLELDFLESESLSARLIMFLAQQMKGTIEFNRDPSEFRLSFSEPGFLESLQL